MLSRIVDNDIPWAVHHNGRYFIDQDPVAFRWLLHFTRCQSLPSGILGAVNELEAIRSLADFLCFQTLLEYVDGAIAKCVEAGCRVEELEDEKAELQKEHNVEIERLRKEHKRELEAMKLSHNTELEPLKRLNSTLGSMDSVTFLCSAKTLSNGWSSSSSRAYCQMAILWSANALGMDRSSIKCPHCGEGAGSKNHSNRNRGPATTPSFYETLF